MYIKRKNWTIKQQPNFIGKCDDLKNAGAAVGEFTDKVKGLSGAIGALDDEFNKFGPIARDLDTLHNQLDEVHGFISKVASRRNDAEDLARDAEDIIKAGMKSCSNLSNPITTCRILSELVKSCLNSSNLVSNHPILSQIFKSS